MKGSNPTIPVRYREIRAREETFIHGIKCRRLTVQDVEQAPEEMGGNTRWLRSNILLGRFDIYAYEEDGNLYSINISTGQTEFQFGLNWEPEEWYHIPSPLNSEIDINGVTRSCSFYQINGVDDGWIVEGIGPNFDFWNMIASTHIDILNGNIFLVECYMGEQLIFSADDFTTLNIPNLGISQINNYDGSDTTLVDLKGRIITDPQRGDIYIDNGIKKILLSGKTLT